MGAKFPSNCVQGSLDGISYKALLVNLTHGIAYTCGSLHTKESNTKFNSRLTCAACSRNGIVVTEGAKFATCVMNVNTGLLLYTHRTLSEVQNHCTIKQSLYQTVYQNPNLAS